MDGYTEAKQKSDMIEAALRDIATLVGEPSKESVELESGGSVIPGLGLASDAADLRKRAKDMQLGIFKVLVLGEFKNGKNTLLNATLGSKVLPAKVTPATAIITTLVYGENKEVAVYETDQPEPRMLSWEDFNNEFKLSKEDIESLDKSGYLDRFQNIEYAQIECQHPFCANGVRLIDSPGLGEQASRTRVTTNFLKQVHAVIFVLNATRILSEDEKQFIDSKLGEGHLNQVFFVINRINQIEQNDLQDVKNWVQSVLKPHFMDTNNQFDHDYYNRRVFFVNALGALQARLADPTDEAGLEKSGVLALEQELEKFLTSEDKVRAVFETNVQQLSRVIAEALRRIAQQKATLDQPLAELEKRRDLAERKLKTLEERKGTIEQTIFRFQDMIKERVYADLRDFVQSMEQTWAKDSSAHINLDEAMSLTDLAQSFFSKGAEAKIAAALAVQVKKYLRAKLNEWSDRIPAVVLGDVTTMMTELENQVEDFQVELDQIANLFAGATEGETDARRSGRLIQLTLGFDDMSGVAQATIEPDDWANLFGRMLQQVITVVVIFGLFSGPLAWLLLLVIEGWFFILHRDKLKQRLVEKLGERLHRELQKELPGKQTEIYAMVEKKFAQFAEHITKTLQTQIDERRHDIERIVRQKQDAGFSVEQELERLTTIHDKLIELTDKISIATYGKALSQAELEHMAHLEPAGVA